MKDNLSQLTVNSVAQLLGREPKGLYEVCRYNIEDQPAIIKVLPIVDNTPFPTLYWLCCPLLKKEISHIEKTGLIKEIESNLFREKPEMLASLKEDHERYRQQRFDLIKEASLKIEELDEGKKKVLSESGIAGIMDWNFIKCFHTHYAHHGADFNTIGQYLDDHFKLNRFLKPKI
ncbi:MAG: DUF501 domain-containing protein [Oligoflexia bacterium]|nr:DUF501 domain-containing protein [Oligoflexia bacterium]